MIYQLIEKKLKIVLYVAILIFIIIMLKLGYSQIYSHSLLKDKASDLWQRSFPVEGNRGQILDINGKVLVTNLTTSSLVIIPNQIQDPLNCAKQLSSILGVDEVGFYEKITKSASIIRISPEGRQLDDDTASQIDKLKLSGVYLIKDTIRYYPNGNYLSHALGFVGIDNQGLVGLELKYDDYLKATNGSINYYMDAKSQNLALYPSVYQEPINGFDMKLTINKDVQDIIERELENAYQIYNPDGIWAIAVNPKTGQILGMSSKPDFDPNDYQSYDFEIYNQNIPIWKTYEPGSTFKVVTFASALNEGLIDLDEQTYYDKGYEYVGRSRIKSWKKGGHGLQTFRQILQNSSNPGFVEIGRRLGKDRLWEYVNSFGLTSKTGVDLVGESAGIMFDYEKFNELEQATVSFGQGISTTPIQLVMAISAAVNGGYLYTPYIVDEIIDPISKETISKTENNLVKQVISEEVSALVRDALETVTTDGGSRSSYIEGYRIGGKTGTAQKAVNGSYVNNGYILSMITVAPINDPEIVLYVAMDNPKNTIQYGGTTVGPIMRKMLVDILPVLGIEKVTEQKQKVQTWEDVDYYLVEDYIGRTRRAVASDYFRFEYVGEGSVVIDQLPRVNEKLEVGSTIIIMLGEE